jgi:FkbM family methyltransferase
MLKRMARYAAVRLTANDRAQAVLARAVKRLNLLRGIGSGSYVESSGEKEVPQLVASGAAGRTAVVFDVGANVGQFSELFATGYPGKFVVHCFEPSRAAHAILIERFGEDPRFRVNRIGLSSAPGAMSLYYDAPASGLASVYRRSLAHKPDLQPNTSEEIAVSTVDAYCAEHGVEQIDLLKIDTEGHELQVLEGAAALIGAGKVGLVLFEFGGCNIDSRTYFYDFYNFFARYPDASIYRLTPSGHCSPILDYEETLEQFGVTNYVVALRGSIRP